MDKFLIAKATDVGIARQVNEDSMTVFDSPNGQVLAVCDGMGGQAAGDVASQLAVNIIENILTDNTFSTPEEAIKRSIVAANQGVLNRTAQNPELEGMGSTCVMMIIKNGRVHCGWVGDSRIYYISNHTIRQISHDQSYVQQLVDSGQITKAEAANHPQRNEITNCIGLDGMSEPDTVAVPILPEPGSVFLLCSDGLSSMVDEGRIERVISGNDMTLQQKADRLVEMANEAGGLDNITVELVQFSTSDNVGATSGTLFEANGVNTARKKSPMNALLYGIIGAVAVAGIAFGGYKLFYKPKAEPQSTPAKIQTTNPTAPSTSSDSNAGSAGSSGGASVQTTSPSQGSGARHTTVTPTSSVTKSPSAGKAIKQETKNNKAKGQAQQIQNGGKKNSTTSPEEEAKKAEEAKRKADEEARKRLQKDIDDK